MIIDQNPWHHKLKMKIINRLYNYKPNKTEEKDTPCYRVKWK